MPVEGNGTSSGSGGQQGNPPNGNPGAGSDAGQQQPQIAARPEWLPETYYDPQKGPAFDRFVEDFNNGRAAIAERDSRLAQRPPEPTGYQPTLPKDFKLPDGVQFEIAADDPLLGDARKWAHDVGLTQDQFSKLIAMRAQLETGSIEQMQALRTENNKALGDKAMDRINASATWIGAKTGKTGEGSLSEWVKEFAPASFVEEIET